MRTTNRHPEFAMKSTADKLLKSISKGLLLLLLSLSCLSAVGATEIQGNWQRRDYILDLKKNGSFSNTDTLLSRLQQGEWRKSKNSLILSADSLADTLTIKFQAKAKLSLDNNSERLFTYHTPEVLNNTGFSFESLWKGLLGIVTLLVLGYLFSSDRKSIRWNQITKGILLQIILALLILKVPYAEDVFDYLSRAFTKVVNMAHEGATFVFGSVVTGNMDPVVKNFVTWILPSVIFFSALSALLYYWGVLQRVVYVMAIVMKRLMGLSGAESVAAAGNIFLGQTEAPLLVKPYLGKMTKSEIMSLMVGGMATIAGGVLAAYIAFLGEGDPIKELFFAKHLLAASIMSAPAAIVFAKMLVPEKEKFDTNLEVSKEKLGSNTLEAIANGTTDGIKLAVNVGAMLIVFVSLIALCNFILFKIGDWSGLNSLIAGGGTYSVLSFEFLTGHLFAPLAWLMGVPWQDAMLVGQLMGEKTILNEFVAYPHLGKLQDELTSKSVIMATYVLCGFANFASIGIQVGGIGALAPERKSQLAKFGIQALIAGTLACMMTAVLVGMIY
jgi:concentrative nucleoside transporter, CNT family